MKRKLSLLLAMVLAMTMVMGISVTAFADIPADYNIPAYDYENGLHWAKTDELITVNLPDGSQYTVWIVSVYAENNQDNSYAYLYTDGEGKYYIGVWIDKASVIYSLTDEEYAPGMTRVEVETTIKNMGKDRCGKDCYLFGWFGEDPILPKTSDSGKSDNSGNTHVHSFKWQTITEPTKDADGLEGEMCSCGAVKNTQPLSAYGYALNEYATPMINAAKSGQTITFEFGEWNSFPKSFMAKLVDKSSQNVTFVFKYKWNHKLQTITIPAGTPIDLNFDWYGPAKMAELYGAN